MTAWKSALSRNLQELRLLVSTTSPGSKGLREFVESSYIELKKSNPLFPILVREKTDVDATVIARYGTIFHLYFTTDWYSDDDDDEHMVCMQSMGLNRLCV